MAHSPTWLSLTDLGRIYGISAIHCGRALRKQGWRDQNGKPTPCALRAGAANNPGPHNHTNSSLWNTKVCGELLKKTGYEPISKAMQVEQWAQLLEALVEGSPSINTTAEQMAEELPMDLINEVNQELSQRGSLFRVQQSSL